MNETVFGRMCDEKRRVKIVFYNHKTNEEYGRVSVVTSEEIAVESNGDVWARVEDEYVGGTGRQGAPGS